MKDVVMELGEYGIIPVVKLDNANDAVNLAKALIEGGLPVAEITFRTDAAEQAIKNIAARYPQMLVGAGTVLNIEQAQRAMDAGARFIVSPGFNPKVVQFCIEKGITIIPGCSSPTDIEMALSFGIEVVKFFPAEAFGGLNALKAISAPYGMVKFVPTGGIDTRNLTEYLGFNKVLACGGSWMVKDELIKTGSFDEITRLTNEAVNTMLGFELDHIGLNTVETDAPMNITLKTRNINRAIAYFDRNDVEIDTSTAIYSSVGAMVEVHLKKEIGGLSFHLLQGK